MLIGTGTDMKHIGRTCVHVPGVKKQARMEFQFHSQQIREIKGARYRLP